MVAFGGNALLRIGRDKSFHAQLENVELACEQIIPLIQHGYNVVIGHGNGPQVGNAMLRQEAGTSKYNIPAMPLDGCVAETQGSIAYLIETAMEKVLKRHGLHRNVISIITRVQVRPDDPHFKEPTKPVGPYLTKEEAEKMHIITGDTYHESSKGRGWRKVVPSPVPIAINNIDIIEDLARKGNIVIAIGGGGIPVMETHYGHKGVEAVIDKDLASSLCAVQIHADEFYILTDVPKVCLNYGKPDQKDIDEMTVAEAKRYLEEGQFASGSMGPKVSAGIFYLENGGKKFIISDAAEINDPDNGTRIVR